MMKIRSFQYIKTRIKVMQLIISTYIYIYNIDEGLCKGEITADKVM